MMGEKKTIGGALTLYRKMYKMQMGNGDERKAVQKYGNGEKKSLTKSQ
jgi:hypothetical protein